MAREISIRRVNPLTEPNWDGKVGRLPGATVFHGAAWARVLQDTYGFQPTYLVLDQGERMVGALPLMEVDSWMTGRRGISLPFTDHCEPLVQDEESLRSLFVEIEKLAASRRWKHWEIRGGVAMMGAPASLSFYGHRIALHRQPAQMLAQFDTSTRGAIKKAEKNNLTISFCQSMEAVKAFYHLLCKTRKRHGLPPQPLRFFENIQRHILRPQLGCVVLASVNQQPVAGAVFFRSGQSALFKYGASDENFQHLRPNNLVFWRAFEWHAVAGCETMDLGRTSLNNAGLRKFKLGWGAKETRIDYARYDCRASTFVTSKDQSSGWHSEVFKHLPTSLARLIGAATYRHVA